MVTQLQEEGPPFTIKPQQGQGPPGPPGMRTQRDRTEGNSDLGHQGLAQPRDTAHHGQAPSVALEHSGLQWLNPAPIDPPCSG